MDNKKKRRSALLEQQSSSKRRRRTTTTTKVLPYLPRELVEHIFSFAGEAECAALYMAATDGDRVSRTHQQIATRRLIDLISDPLHDPAAALISMPSFEAARWYTQHAFVVWRHAIFGVACSLLGSEHTHLQDVFRFVVESMDLTELTEGDMRKAWAVCIKAGRYDILRKIIQNRPQFMFSPADIVYILWNGLEQPAGFIAIPELRDLFTAISLDQRTINRILRDCSNQERLDALHACMTTPGFLGIDPESILGVTEESMAFNVLDFWLRIGNECIRYTVGTHIAEILTKKERDIPEYIFADLGRMLTKEDIQSIDDYYKSQYGQQAENCDLESRVYK